jgi:uncharacterized protein (TIGR02611 family)
MTEIIIKTLRQAKRIVVIVVGFTILLAGIVMIVTPGPAVVVIPIGLGILATEFVWAKNLLNKFRLKNNKGNPQDNNHQ